VSDTPEHPPHVTDAAARLTAALGSRYLIERDLGQGGMATVYLAQDLKHDRKVALKVLKPELAAVLGAERFIPEIKTTAALQHPHILPLFDSGQADGFLYYVMPYVEGETLRGKLDREKQLGIDEAVRITTEVADALDYAHRHGVIHRDIKPENILLHDGRPMVADFGIALAVSAAAGGRMTETGLSLGTPHYMSPEQATAEKDLSARSDIYSLACVLYEMLAGSPPHVGASAQQIIMKIVTEEAVPVTTLRKSVPPNIAAAIATALEKLPADRFDSARAFVEALANPSFAGPTAAATAVGPRRRDWRPWAVAVGLGVAGLIIGRLLPGPETSASIVARFRVPVDAERGLTGAPVNTLALSPDGRTVVYVGRAGGGASFRLYERRLSELSAFRPIPGTEGGAYPAFSPDGTRLAFLGSTGVQVMRVPFTGAPPTPVAANAVATGGVLWLDDATLVATDAHGGILRAGLDGRVATIAQPDTSAGERNLYVQAALPDRRTLLATVSTGTGSEGPVVALDSRDGKRTTVLETEVSAAWCANGYLLWSLPNGALQAAPFDARRHRITGSAVTLAEGVRQAIGGGGQVAVSASGTLVYLPEQPFSLVLLDHDARREVVAEGHRFHSPRFSPDGRYLAMDFIQQGSRDVWTLDLRQRTLSRLSFENDGHDPVWSRDGRWVYYVHATGIWRRRADGAGGADSVYMGDYTQALELAPDGTIIGAATGTNGLYDLMLVSAGSPRTRTPLLATPYNEEAATLSPNGRWLAYASDETGKSEVYVRPYPTGGAKILVSQGGGIEPRWSPDGRTLYYQSDREGAPYLFASAVGPGPDFTVTSRTPLFDISQFEPAEPHANWDVSPDGTRFVMVDQGALIEMIFVLNWPEDVRRQNGARGR
jgi:Tol biopolymer transport system component/tRNA A-37 threonylcarbamoyl transferase component Bud32